MTNKALIQAWIDRYYYHNGKDTGNNNSRSMSYRDGILFSYNMAIARFNPSQLRYLGTTATTRKHIKLAMSMLDKEGIKYDVVEKVSTYVDFSQEPWRDPKRIPKEKEGI